MGMMTSIKRGDRFERFTIVEEVEKRNGKRYFLCRCDCGNGKIVRLSHLKSGTTKSCGCYTVDFAKKQFTKHGKSRTRLYKVWLDMRNRCSNKNHKNFKHYGGRGICICQEWNDYETFYDWATDNGYGNNLTIERVNVDGNYEPSNCTWITINEQQRNKRRSKQHD